MKHHISYFYNALLEQVHFCIKHGVKQSSSSTKKEIDSYKVCSKCPPGRQICVCLCSLRFHDFEPIHPQMKSQLPDVMVCRFPQAIKQTSFLENA